MFEELLGGVIVDAICGGCEQDCRNDFPAVIIDRCCDPDFIFKRLTKVRGVTALAGIGESLSGLSRGPAFL